MTEEKKDILAKRFLRSQTNSTLTQNLECLEVIMAFEKGKFNIGNKRQIFDAKVETISKDEPDINTVSEEWIGKRFGINGWNKQREIRSALYYAVGKCKDTSRVSLADLERWSDCVMDSPFFYALDFSRDDIKRLIKEIKDNPMDALRHVHYCGFTHKVSKSLLNIKAQPYDAEYLESLTKDCNYILLPESLYLVSEYCLCEKAYDLWLDLMMAFPNIELRAALLLGIHTVEELRSIYNEIGKRPYSNKKLKYIIRDRFMDLIVSETLNLVDNAENKSLGKKWLQVVHEVKSDLDTNYREWLESMAKDWRRVFSFNEMSAWLNKQENRIANKKLRSSEIKTKYLDVIRKQLTYKQCESKIDYRNYSADELISLAGSLRAKRYKPEFFEGLSKSICERLYKDRFVPTIDISNDGLRQLRGVYACLKKGKVNGIDLFNKYCRPDEGFSAPSPGIDTHRADNIWLGVLALQLENDPDKIEEMENLLFSYSRIEGDSDSYFLPFYILELIVCQNIGGLKDRFEERLLSEVCSLIFVIRVLTANGGSLSGPNRERLTRRVNNEWEIEKSIYLNKNYADMFHKLDDYLRGLKIIK